VIGEIESPIGNLKSTLRAARMVNGMGGFSEVFRKLAAFDLDAYILIACAGLGKKTSEIEDKVYEAGLPALIESFSKYVECLSNGGKPIKPAVDGGGASSGEA
jgi:hypothetical protein